MVARWFKLERSWNSQLPCWSFGRRRGRLLIPVLMGVIVFAGLLASQAASAKSPTAAALDPPAQSSQASLPAGTLIHIRLVTSVSTRTSHLHQVVTARVVREVPGPQGVLIPLGAQLQGQLDKLIPTSNPSDRARLRLRFDHLEIPGRPTLALQGHLVEVENARESVLSDGTVQGVLASELPLSHLENALGKLGKSAGTVVQMKDKALGKSDTSIDFPAGTDMVWALDRPLVLDGPTYPSAAGPIPASASAQVARLLENAPQRASSKDGKPGDPLNLVVIGSMDQIRQAFQAAGWSEAEKMTGQSIWDTIRAVAGDQGYGQAPVSQLYVYGRPEDLAFEKMLDTFMKRHHLRLWRSSATTSDGREIWLGAATHDTGLDVRPGVVSHAIDPDLDAERAKVGADLLATGRVSGEQLTTRPNPLSEGLTATGATWKTDGRLLIIDLKSSGS
jgi:hypothetical protein